MAERRNGRVADIVDGVVWDYDPENDQPSPLVSTRRYFRDFPWDDDDPASKSATIKLSGDPRR